MTRTVERRHLPARCEVREVGGQIRTISGYASVYYVGTAGSEFELWRSAGERGVERVLPGAFDRALAEGDDVVALQNHNPDCVLGRVGAGTLALRGDGKGLAYDITPPDTQVARDLVTSIARGDVTGSSFAFTVDEQSFREARDGDGGMLVVRELRSVTL